MMNGKKSFILYCDIGEQLDLLPVDECGRLFRAIVAYVNTGQIAQLSPAGQMAFAFLKAQIDRESEKWEAVREKRREAGQKGGLAKVANAKSAKQTVASVAVSVPVPVPVPDTVPVPIKDNGAKAPTRKKFVAPDESDVLAYFAEQGSTNSEAASFYDYYTANGWTQGRGKGIKNWQAAARSWIRRAGQFTQTPRANSEASPLEIYRNL